MSQSLFRRVTAKREPLVTVSATASIEEIRKEDAGIAATNCAESEVAGTSLKVGAFSHRVATFRMLTQERKS